MTFRAKVWLRAYLSLSLLAFAGAAEAKGVEGIGWVVLTAPVVWPFVALLIATETGRRRRELEASSFAGVALIVLAILGQPFTIDLALLLARWVGAPSHAAFWILLVVEMIFVGVWMFVRRWRVGKPASDTKLFEEEQALKRSFVNSIRRSKPTKKVSNRARRPY